MLYIIILAMIGNRYHPVVLQESPFPGDGPENVIRLRSVGHHTVGFDTRSEAEDEIVNMKEKLGTPDENVYTETVMEGYDGSAFTQLVRPWAGTGHKVFEVR